ncbi:MAG: hypothetical protein O8C63_08505 [Candidatus Methanoperedens sp.]|nr:hypothetical protein [Candidatus Methanoperedens sp.]
MGRNYHVFLSCEDDILIENKAFQDFLNNLLIQGAEIDIKCIKKHKDLEISRQDLEDLKDSSIYVVNTHKELDYISSWELGYAMGKGIKIIGYFDGKNAVKIQPDIGSIIRPIPPNVSRFVDILNRHLEKLKAKEPVLEDWENQKKMVVEG